MCTVSALFNIHPSLLSARPVGLIEICLPKPTTVSGLLFSLFSKRTAWVKQSHNPLVKELFLPEVKRSFILKIYIYYTFRRPSGEPLACESREHVELAHINSIN